MRLVKIVASVLLAACGGGDGASAPPPPRVTSLTITAPTSTLVAGTTTALTVSGRDQAGQPIATGPVSWTSSNSSTATVDASGVVTGISAGAVTIVAAASGLTATTALTVTPAPVVPRLTTLTITTATSSIVAGTTTALAVSGRDQTGQAIAVGTVAWTSSNSAVATVTSAGVVTGVGAGAVTISATASGVTATTALTVTAAPVLSRLTVILGAASVASGTRVPLTVSGADQFNAPLAVTSVVWSSSAPNVATVQGDGTALAVAAGTTTLTARVGAVTGTAQLTVTPGAAARLVMLRPAAGIFTNWRFGTQPQIEVTDAAGNRVVTDNTTVVQLGAPGGLIGVGTATATAGIATFASTGLVAGVGTAQTLTFSATGLTSATQAVMVAPFSFGNGTRLVNIDIKPGRYRSVNSLSASCYWARLRNTTGTNSIIANDIGPGPRLVEILASDVAIESSSCASWTEVTGPVTTSRTAPITDGVYLVGIDIEPGTWRTDGTASSCYWARLRNLTGNDDIIANNIGQGPAIMTLLASDTAVEFSRCGTWTRVP